MENSALLSRAFAKSVAFVLAFAAPAPAQQLPREQWGAPAVAVSHAGGKWTIAGKRNKLTLDESDLSVKVQAGAALWEMVPSSAKDVLVRSRGEEFYLRLADARRMTITPYDTGFKTGVKISLGEWREGGPLHPGEGVELSLPLTLC